MTAAQFTGGQPQTALYAYDADGRRVKRKAGAGAEVWQVYGAGGELVAEYAAYASPSSPSKEYGYRAGELLVTAEAPSTPRANVALSSAGTAVTASSSYGASFPASSLTDGDRKGTGWGSGGGWNDATPSAFPDSVEITFSGAKTIDEVSVFTLQDNFSSPAEPTESLTFAQYGVTSFTVQAWVGGGWTTVPNGAVTGNDKVWRRVSFPPVTTTKVRVQVSATADGASRLTEVEAREAQRANHALGAGGATAAASSTAGAGFPAAAAIDGDRKGLNWGAGGGWNDATEGVFTDDWLEVTFPSAKAVDEVNVFTLQDSFSAPADPTEALTFSLYGLTSFEVQYWDGSGWQAVPNGAVTGNNKVWRRVTFPAVVTSKVRVRALGAADGYSRVVELEAWGPTSTGGGAQVKWLVADHLGTPRLVVDQTGSLAGVSRHDYFPFGEELAAGVGGRATNQGYEQHDGVRQRYTSTERDDETGLDYMKARYYSSSQGRFTSTDPLLASGTIYDPQSWNRYTYALNNPLKFTDPFGLYVFSAELGSDQTDDELWASATTKKRRKEVEKILKQRDKIRNALERARAAANDQSLTANQRAAAQRAVNSYGEFNDGKHDNVVVGLVKIKNDDSRTDGNNPDGNIYVNLNLGRSDRDPAVTVAHEGSHVADFQSWLGNRGGPFEAAFDITQYETESRAFFVSSYIAQGLGLQRYYPEDNKCTEVWNKGWQEQQREAYRAVGIGTRIWEKYRAHPKGGPLAPNNPGFTLSTSP